MKSLAIRGPRGPVGPQGPPGANGDGSAWAVLRVTSGGTHSPPAQNTLVVIDAPGASVTIRLPAVADVLGTSGAVIVKIKRSRAFAVAVDPRAGDTLEPGAGTALDVDGTSGDFASDGTAWFLT